MAHKTPLNLLTVKGLSTWFGSHEQPFRVVDKISFDIRKGETFALLGESGCGKSMTALSLMQLVPTPAGRIVSGNILFQDEDLLQYSEQKMRRIRGQRMAMIFQEPMTSLNPVLTIGEQIAEVLRLQPQADRTQKKILAEVVRTLAAVGLPDPGHRLNDYPHQLSGGMKQRVMIAIALAAKPALLIADEPTTALDVTIQAQVLDLLRDIQQQTDMAILLITHDLGIVADRVDRLAVMYAGQLIELATREQFFSASAHPYSRKLFAALPGMHKRDTQLDTIRGNVPPLNTVFRGCRFVDRCEQAHAPCDNEIPDWHTLADGHRVRCHLYAVRSSVDESVFTSTGEPVTTENRAAQPMVMQARDLKVHFPIRKGLFKRIVGYVYAVDGIDLNLYQGQTLALVGESGCGKTTAGKALLQLIRPSHGSVQLQGQELTSLKGKKLRRLRTHFQIIFQDPFSSLNPRMMVGEILQEGIRAQHIVSSHQQGEAVIDRLLQQVGMPLDARYRYPHEFSGGQRQRISIARALAVKPDLIVCDEPTSALDVSVQAQTLNLLKKLQVELGISYLFITHNISVVEYLAHEIAVMYLGRIVEKGLAEKILLSPKHPYTNALLSAVPVIKRESKESGSREVIRLKGELPSPIYPPTGCHFHPRCPQVMDKCRQTYPSVSILDGRHEVRCHLFNGK
ncbi:MAG TPA: ABC transporter ATP-binding protein [Gammaproteobacteria bacterium]|nr:ABC transporter ATP-binding protein [Gammaproteobacteria bacterium]